MLPILIVLPLNKSLSGHTMAKTQDRVVMMRSCIVEPSALALAPNLFWLTLEQRKRGLFLSMKYTVVYSPKQKLHLLVSNIDYLQ